MTRAIAIATLALAIAGPGSTVPGRGSSVPGPGSTVHVPTSIDVLVLGPEGLPQTDLAQSDFEVLADGKPVPITQFGRSRSELSIVMLVDGTASQPLRRYEIVAGVTTGLIPNLQAGDRARLAYLGSSPTLSPWLPADQRAALNLIRPTLDRLPLESSPLWDAIDLSVQALAQVPEPRVLLLMTDGRANGNKLGLDDAQRNALLAKVSISAVSEGGEWLIPQVGASPERPRSDASLRRLADETGGIYLPDGTARRTLRAQMNAFAYVKELVNTPSAPAPLVSTIVTSLRSRYRIGFNGEADGRVHSMEVRAKRPGVEVRAPKLYVN